MAFQFGMTAIRSTANGFHSISLNRFFGTRSKNSNMSTSGSALSSSALSSVVTRFSSVRSEEHTSELQSLMRISYAVFCLKKNQKQMTTRQKIKDKSNKE